MNKIYSVDPATKTNINEYYLDSDHEVDDIDESDL